VASMPFRVSRRQPGSLIEQVAAGLRNAILAGRYRAGDALPSRQRMADALGVSEIVIRRAVQRLAREGVLNVRAGARAEVCGDALKSWRGHVLYIHWSGASMYYHNILCGVMVERLDAAGVLVTTQHVNGSDLATGFPKVQAYLAHAITLAAVEGPAEGLDAFLAGRGIRFVHLYSDRVPHSELADAGIMADRAPALAAMREHCLACGVRTVLEVTSLHDGNDLSPGAFDPGDFEVETLRSCAIPGLGSPEAVERGAVVAMQKWLDGKPELPDLIWFDDDFTARGALLALTARGLRVPEDVQAISWANKGLGPVFLKPLTRVEMDPVRHGEILAQCILDRLDGKPRPTQPIELAPTLILGETTADKRRCGNRQSTPSASCAAEPALTGGAGRARSRNLIGREPRVR